MIYCEKYAKAMDRRDHRVNMYRQAEPYISLFSDTKSLGLVKAEEYEHTINQQQKQLEEMQQQVNELTRLKTLAQTPESLKDNIYDILKTIVSPEQLAVMKQKEEEGRQRVKEHGKRQ